MTLQTLFLFFLCLFSNCYSYIKLLKRQDLNIFDLISVFQSLFFIFIPIKAIIEGVYYRDLLFEDIVNHHPLTLVYYLIFSGSLNIINYFYTISIGTQPTIININAYIKKLNDNTFISLPIIYISVIFFIIYLYPLINYGGLNEDNFEGNLTYQYALNMPLFQRMLVVTSATCFPAFVLMVIKYVRDNNAHAILTKLALALALICSLLGQRTTLVFVIVVIIVYFYSVDRSLFTAKRFIYFSLFLLIVTSLFFPFSLAFRITKQRLVLSAGYHSFTDVVKEFATLSTSDLTGLLQESSEGTKGRSLNVYIAFDQVSNNSYYSTSGALTFDQLKCLFPLIKPDLSLDNKIGNTIEGFGSDIGESALTFFVFDLGFLGIFVSPLYFIIYVHLSEKICQLFVFVFKDRRIYFLFLVLVLQICYFVEFIPSIRYIYNPCLLVYITFSIILLGNKVFKFRLMA